MVAAAMFNDTFPADDDTGYIMQKTLKGFQGRYYSEIGKANKEANGNYEAFAAVVDPLYAQYQADIAEYEASKAEEEAKEEVEGEAPVEETPAE